MKQLFNSQASQKFRAMHSCCKQNKKNRQECHNNRKILWKYLQPPQAKHFDTIHSTHNSWKPMLNKYRNGRFTRTEVIWWLWRELKWAQEIV